MNENDFTLNNFLILTYVGGRNVYKTPTFYLIVIKMEMYYAGFQPSKKLDLGTDGYRLKGSVLFVPSQIGILYLTSLGGDADCCGFVDVGIDLTFVRGYDNYELNAISESIRGKYARTGNEFDLTTRLKKFNLSSPTNNKQKFDFADMVEDIKEFRKLRERIVSESISLSCNVRELIND